MSIHQYLPGFIPGIIYAQPAATYAGAPETLNYSHLIVYYYTYVIIVSQLEEKICYTSIIYHTLTCSTA